MAVRWCGTRARLAAGLLCLTLTSCSKSETSPSALCDNEGTHLIAFASDRGHAGRYEIYLFDADAGGYRALHNLNQASASHRTPALSRDGQLVAFVAGPEGGDTDVRVYERVSCSVLATAGLVTAGAESDPAFSGDAQRLAFARDTLGHRRIRLVNASGGAIVNVPLPGLDATSATYDDWGPSPDLNGNRIAFVSDREGSPHVYLYDRTTGRVDSLRSLRAAEPAASDLDPALTPDGVRLAFASDRAGGRGGFDLYLADLSVATPVATLLAVPNTSGNERSPSVGTTAQYISFESDSTVSGTGRDVRYYSRLGGALIPADALAGTGDDAHPSVRLP